MECINHRKWIVNHPKKHHLIINIVYILPEMDGMKHPKLEVYFWPYPLEIFSKGGVVHGWIPKIHHGSHVPRGNPQDITLSNFCGRRTFTGYLQ